jgi:hypothetical protein
MILGVRVTMMHAIGGLGEDGEMLLQQIEEDLEESGDITVATRCAASRIGHNEPQSIRLFASTAYFVQFSSLAYSRYGYKARVF